MEDADQTNTTNSSVQNADDTASSTTTFKGFSPQRAIADAIATGWGNTSAEADYTTDLPWDEDGSSDNTEMPPPKNDPTALKRKAHDHPQQPPPAPPYCLDNFLANFPALPSSSSSSC